MPTTHTHLIGCLFEVHHGGVVVLLDHVAALEVHLSQEGHGHGVAGVGGLLEVVQRQPVVGVDSSASLHEEDVMTVVN